MKRKIFLCVVIFALVISMFSGCTVTKIEENTVLYQISTLQALMVGAYDGK